MNAFTLNCETCGGPLNYSADGLTAVCPYCGNKYNFRAAKSEAVTLALNRANAMRIACDFDGAIREYSLIAERCPEDSEAWWGLTLSTYGIEYVADSRTKRLVPTCRRYLKNSILTDENYLNAIKFAPPEQAEQYRARAEVIDRLQRAIGRRLDEEENFDIFLSYRSADENGAPTKERVVARRIYDELTRRGFKVFSSEVTLKNRLGEDFEPIIYKALYSCSFFILIACSEQNLNSPWVKNEWSRFRDRQEEEHLSSACCAVFENISPSALPPFLRSQQGVNLAKYPAGGYEIELADSLSARLGRVKSYNHNGASNYSGVSAPSAADSREALRRAKTDLEAGLFESAHLRYTTIAEDDPACGEAWWGRFLADNNASSGTYLARNVTYAAAVTFNSDRNLKNAIRFGDEKLRAEIADFRRECIAACTRLACDCDSELRTIKKRQDTLAAERKKVAASREKTFKKLERTRKAASVNPKIILLTMGGVMAFFLIFAIILGVALEEAVVSYIFLAMIGMCLVAMLISYGTMKKNRSEAAAQVPDLERQLATIDTALSEMSAVRERDERAAEDLNRRATELRAVFASA